MYCCLFGTYADGFGKSRRIVSYVDTVSAKGGDARCACMCVALSRENVS